jgi:uncharacterized membrane protein YeaQ/YmgE (transglycosylase-associated protein family)
MSMCGWIVLGSLAGWVASIVAGTNAKMGLVANLAVGVIGAVVGGFVFNLLGGHGVTGLNLYSLGVSVAGSVIVLFVAKKVF